MRAESSEGSEDSEYSEVLKEPEESDEQLMLETLKFDQPPETADNASILCKDEKLSHTPECHHDLILALLLPSLFKVERLALDLSLRENYEFLERMIRRAVDKGRPLDIQPPFQALTAFMYVHGTSFPRSTLFFASLLKLPVIQEISGGFGHSRIRIPDKKLRESVSPSSPLASLDLASYAIWPADLGYMLRTPKALKTLLFKFCSPAYTTLKDVRHALRTQENCLESLGLDYEEQCYEADMGNVGPMTSFASFNTLKVFKIGVAFLDLTDNGYEHDKLINLFPPNLETLHLTRFEGLIENDILEATEHLLTQNYPQQIPSLKNIVIEGNKSPESSVWRNPQERAVEGLFRVAEAHGVVIEDRLQDP